MTKYLTYVLVYRRPLHYAIDTAAAFLDIVSFLKFKKIYS